MLNHSKAASDASKSRRETTDLVCPKSVNQNYNMLPHNTPTLFDSVEQEIAVRNSPNAPQANQSETNHSRAVHNLVHDFCSDLEADSSFMKSLHFYLFNRNRNGNPAQLVSKISEHLNPRSVEFEIFMLSIEGMKDVISETGMKSSREFDQYDTAKTARLKHKIARPEIEDFFNTKAVVDFPAPLRNQCLSSMKILY